MTPTMEELIQVTVNNRARKLANEITQHLYVDSRPSTRWQRARWRFQNYRTRIRGARDVLLGRAEANYD
jgi:hypothetical protein